ncbi:hypothetical protein D3C81_907930 [compost metagenome]
MKERKRRQVLLACFLAFVEPKLGLNRVGYKIHMGEHNPFGNPGGSSGVLDQGQVLIRIHLDIARQIGRILKTLFEGKYALVILDPSPHPVLLSLDWIEQVLWKR